jgi:choline dehydrogenase-like flavoprotein
MRSFDAAVVGSGSFGAWTAWHLRRVGLSVALVTRGGETEPRFRLATKATVRKRTVR